MKLNSPKSSYAILATFRNYGPVRSRDSVVYLVVRVVHNTLCHKAPLVVAIRPLGTGRKRRIVLDAIDQKSTIALEVTRLVGHLLRVGALRAVVGAQHSGKLVRRQRKQPFLQQWMAVPYDLLVVAGREPIIVIGRFTGVVVEDSEVEVAAVFRVALQEEAGIVLAIAVVRFPC